MILNEASTDSQPIAHETVTVERMSFGAEGISHLANGKTVFVQGAVTGDECAIEVFEEKKSFVKARAVEVLTPGPNRVSATCPYGQSCGGCPWQCLSYEAQLEAKRANVVSALVRNARFPQEDAERLVAPVEGSKRTWGYRNKLELNAYTDASGALQVGFARAGSHDFFCPDMCSVVHKPIQKAARSLRGALRYLQGSGDLGLFRVGVRCSVRTHDVEVALWTTPGAFPRNAVAKTLQDALRANSVVRVMAQPGRERKIKGVETLAGKGCWGEELAGFDYLTSAPAFFQVNTAQAEKLIAHVIKGLSLQEGQYVADLYSGGGTFSIPLADAGADVVAVESVGASVRDLRRNAERAGVFVDVVGGDAAREIQMLEDLDALVVDPPRAGLAKGVPDDIAATGARRLAYVSCDAQTWARDVACLRKLGFKLKQVQPVDLFPQTYHCELVSIFEKC